MKADVHGPVSELRAKAADKGALGGELTAEAGAAATRTRGSPPDGREPRAAAGGMRIHGEESYRPEPTPSVQGVFESAPKAVTALHARAAAVAARTASMERPPGMPGTRPALWSRNTRRSGHSA
ncbi:hypothetical protein [Streptomyces europaeiscabiei]|uniref:hypothetical protein n=1 Tax=Streptomyces europaeiscabiei TaxID=146819 RepID=UPI0038F6ACFF